MSMHPFYKTTIPLERNLFNDLTKDITFEVVGKGRIGNNIVKSIDDSVPVVRTTTQYTIPAHYFTQNHLVLLSRIKKALEQEEQPEIDFNCGLIEIYEDSYTKMKYHSDQSLDLEKGSYIGLFSCYEYPDNLTNKTTRILRIKEKSTEEEFEIRLTQNSLVLFSLEANSKYSHKIILENSRQQKQQLITNKWLGITFRTSKNRVKFKDSKVFFNDDTEMVLANTEQEKEFYQLRGEENRSVDFTYPTISYTLSKADLMEPIGLER